MRKNILSKAEILYGELQEIFEDPEAFLEKDFSDRMYELLELIDKEPEQIDDIISQIEFERKNNDFCPKCGLPLATRNFKENRGECRGNECQETITEFYCEHCGWDENKDC